MQNNRKLYIQLTLCIIIFIILIFEIVFCISKCIKITNDKTINYTEEGNINYKVLLKENEFYDQDYLENDMIYVSSLIDKISIDFKHNFNVEQKGEYNLLYQITSKLIIKDTAEDKIFFEKSFDINKKEKTVETLSDFQENTMIDYSYYNSISSSFKTKYGIDSESFLRVELKISKSSEDITLDESSMYIDIPLSERAIKIKMSQIDLQHKNKIIENKGYKVNNLIYVLFIAIFFIFAALDILIIKILYSKKSKFRKEVDKLLREYDRLIVETTVEPTKDKTNTYELNDFKELLDVRDNLKLPILFCENSLKHIAYFYIKYEDSLYLYQITDNHNQEVQS